MPVSSGKYLRGGGGFDLIGHACFERLELVSILEKRGAGSNLQSDFFPLQSTHSENTDLQAPSSVLSDNGTKGESYAPMSVRVGVVVFIPK